MRRVFDLKTNLQDEIKSKFPELYKVNIHIEPEKKEILRYAIPLSENNGIDSPIATHFGSAPFFAFYDYKTGGIVDQKIQENPFLSEEKRKGILVGEWLAKKSVDKLLLREELKAGAKLALEKHLIDVDITPFTILRDLEMHLKKHLSKKLD
jgi:predicted Fe-Mo cluster-binding NifX family protein